MTVPVLEPVPEDERIAPVAARRARYRLVRGSPRWRLLGIAATVASLLAMIGPIFVLPIIEGRLTTQFVAVAVALLGLQFVLGHGGQLSLCHGVFVGVGSYSMAIMVAVHDWPHLVGLLSAPVFGFLAGCLVGVLALRIKATYLGPVTMSVAVVFPMIVKRFSWFTGGPSGLPLLPVMPVPDVPLLSGLRPHEWTHLVVAAYALASYWVLRNLVRSPVGLAVKAVAENPTAARTSGINTRRTQVLAFGVGAAFGALGGALLVVDTPVVGADSYDLFRSLGYYAAVMVGGVASLAGGVIGAGLLVGMPWMMTKLDLGVTPNLVFGLLLLVSTLVAPGGIASAMRSVLATRVDVQEPEPASAAGVDSAAPG